MYPAGKSCTWRNFKETQPIQGLCNQLIRRPGKGTLFVVELPVLEETAAAGRTDYAAAPLPAGLKILVVDDEILIRNVSIRILRSLDCVPDSAAGGAEAIEKLKANPYDAVFCAIRMPEMDGRELYRWVCANKPEFTLKWVFMTGSIGSEGMDGSDESGKPCMHKPFTVEALQRRLQDLARGPQTEGRLRAPQRN